MISDANETRLTMWHRTRMASSFATRIDGHQITTTLEIGNKVYQVRSDQRNHSKELARVLRDLECRLALHT